MPKKRFSGLKAKGAMVKRLKQMRSTVLKLKKEGVLDKDSRRKSVLRALPKTARMLKLLPKAEAQLATLLLWHAPGPRYAAANMLYPRRSKRFVSLIEQGLKDSDSRIRVLAIKALIEINSKKSLPMIKKRLLDKHPKVRSWALRATAYLDPDNCVPVLTKQLTDPDSSVVKTAIKLLEGWRDGILHIQ